MIIYQVEQLMNTKITNVSRAYAILDRVVDVAVRVYGQRPESEGGGVLFIENEGIFRVNFDDLYTILMGVTTNDVVSIVVLEGNNKRVSELTIFLDGTCEEKYTAFAKGITVKYSIMDFFNSVMTNITSSNNPQPVEVSEEVPEELPEEVPEELPEEVSEGVSKVEEDSETTHTAPVEE